MLKRPTVILAVGLLLLTTTLPALASDGTNRVEAPGFAVTNDDQHETLIELTVSDDPSEVGRMLTPFDGEVAAVNMAILPGGKVLYFSGVEADESADGPTQLQFIWEATPLPGRSRVLDLSDLSVEADGTVNLDADAIAIPDPEHGGEYDIFCSGTTVGPGGQAVVPGATVYETLDQDPATDQSFFSAPLQGWEQALTYDQEANAWEPTKPMDVARWYPSAVQLPNGDTMVASGIRDLFWPQTYNTLVETYDPSQSDADWENMDTSFEVAPGVTIDDHELQDTPDTGISPADDVHRGVPNLPMYPRLHVIPSGPNQGEVLYGANGDVWGPFGQHPIQSLWGVFQTLDPDTGTWEVHEPSSSNVRNLGTTVPMMVDADDPKPKYLSFGGTIQQGTVATSSAEIIDASSETISSTPTEPMTFPRWSVNGVLLPDGSVVSIGGSMYDNVVVHGSPNAAPLNVERFVPGDGPTGGSWEMGPALSDSRAYHSTAALMPDGRVLIGGHVPLPAFHHHQRHTLGNPQPVDSSFEIYEPSYLFHEGEDRPVIEGLGADDQVNGQPQLEANFGDTISIPVSGLDTLDSVTLMRPGATTHQYNADQLGVELTVDNVQEQGGGDKVVTVTLPSQEDLAIAPGSYMLFVNEDANGAADGGFYPSEAAWVDLIEPSP